MSSSPRKRSHDEVDPVRTLDQELKIARLDTPETDLTSQGQLLTQVTTAPQPSQEQNSDEDEEGDDESEKVGSEEEEEEDEPLLLVQEPGSQPQHAVQQGQTRPQHLQQLQQASAVQVQQHLEEQEIGFELEHQRQIFERERLNRERISQQRHGERVQQYHDEQVLLRRQFEQQQLRQTQYQQQSFGQSHQQSQQFHQQLGHAQQFHHQPQQSPTQQFQLGQVNNAFVTSASDHPTVPTFASATVAPGLSMDHAFSMHDMSPIGGLSVHPFDPSAPPFMQNSWDGFAGNTSSPTISQMFATPALPQVTPNLDPSQAPTIASRPDDEEWKPDNMFMDTTNGNYDANLGPEPAQDYARHGFKPHPGLPPASGFPNREAFDKIVADYIQSLSIKKRDKALISIERYECIKKILHHPKSTEYATAQFRFWAKKMFKLGKTDEYGWNLVVHDGKPVATTERLPEILYEAHGRCMHGGRDKTANNVKDYWAWVPKELIARYVRHCPTCEGRRVTKRQARDALRARTTDLQSTHDVEMDQSDSLDSIESYLSAA